jgi:nucleoside 2-deoxyribosyltransferase
MRIYLASRYKRREELCVYRQELREMGHIVEARWLNGSHQISDKGIPIGDEGEAMVEATGGIGKDGDELRQQFARDDIEDVCFADTVINFTEPPRSEANGGGRHVEYGIAMALQKRLIIVGYRENIFHWVPFAEFYETWADAKKSLKEEGRA